MRRHDVSTRLTLALLGAVAVPACNDVARHGGAREHVGRTEAPLVVAIESGGDVDDLLYGAIVGGSASSPPPAPPPPASAWTQWAGSAAHDGRVTRDAQPLGQNLADFLVDPFVDAEKAAAGALNVHYQTPLVVGDRVFMMLKDPTAPFDASSYATQRWGETSLQWSAGQLVPVWTAWTTWKPPGSVYDFWEPVFHPSIAGGHIYLPAAAGALEVRDLADGSLDTTIEPFDGDPDVYTVSPVTADAQGNLYYDVVRLQPGLGIGADVAGSWIVKVTPAHEVLTQSFGALVFGAPAATEGCTVRFSSPPPWPPSPAAVAPTIPCGTLRAALNAAPAVGADGTVYVVARSHFAARSAFLVAMTGELEPMWAASLAGRLHDGCGVPAALGGQLPPNGAPGGCASGAPVGVDPTINQPGGGIVDDSSSASPVVAPDGTVLIGTLGAYNYEQGHLMHFGAGGEFLGAYPFGWDTTPAILRAGARWSVVLKENHYGDAGSYCDDPTNPACPTDRTASNPASPEAYFITQLDEHLHVQWQLRSGNTESCSRAPDGTVSCVSDHPHGFEWCVNAAVVDGTGRVYANSEDGWLYAIEQGGRRWTRIFQNLATDAAYTPTSIGPDGLVYSQNDGHLFVVGAATP